MLLAYNTQHCMPATRATTKAVAEATIHETMAKRACADESRRPRYLQLCLRTRTTTADRGFLLPSYEEDEVGEAAHAEPTRGARALVVHHLTKHRTAVLLRKCFVGGRNLHTPSASATTHASVVRYRMAHPATPRTRSWRNLQPSSGRPSQPAQTARRRRHHHGAWPPFQTFLPASWTK